MTITPSVRISEGKLVVRGRPILSGVAENAVASSAASHGPVDGVFLGADFARPDSRHVLPLGSLSNVRFLACFRFKLWWMAQKMGEQASEIPCETQFLLLESKFGAEEPIYAVFLPLIAGPFRACLQGNSQNQLELCLESGDAGTVAAAFSHALFVGAAASDPFAAVSGAVAAVKSHLKTFRLRSEKKLPGIDVDQEGVEAGLRSLTAGGAPPKFVIIDDGWQSVATDHGEKTHPLPRLTGIKENTKFQNKEDPSAGIESIVRTAKELYGLKYVYVWHAITGYWGGIRPGAEGMEEYGSEMQYPKISPGVTENEPSMATDVLTTQGLGLVNPKSVFQFYNELHAYLASAGIDGVKVDVQCILETLGGGLGGRVQLTRQYHQALDASVAKNFPDNGIIACMSHNTDALYCAKQTAVVRASDDFFPRDPVSHTIHIASVAYNSVFLGEFMLPDWDMFHSLHPAAEYHASARAISGGPIYVSDAPGKHNFELLRKLVLPDGSILRARLPGRPTRDCLFTDPARDGISLLKIWNMNKFAGVVGVYNCQGAAWSSTEKKNVFHHTGAEALTSVVRGNDVHLIAEAAADPDWKGDCAVYSHRSGDLVVLPPEAALPVSLKVLEHDIFAVSPIKELAPGFRFAPLGLIDMFNAGGAVEGLTYHILNGIRLLELDSSFVGAAVNGDSTHSSEISRIESVGIVCIEVRGCGRFGAYSSVKPRKCTVGSVEVEFSYDSASGLLVLQLDSMPKERVHKVVVEL
ncbi:putative galactinol--sucrose galactosyltransferase 6 [Ananas comosus]|uniref:galactinol--sucrose galactosyltransferase n=1 Tax=Ananas comosus TaxID=4615 RepID=A0A199UPQ4_ANACO|nr:putative galactinol--sucrose galactosyltransferase 6 [Ananas comosus]